MDMSYKLVRREKNKSPYDLSSLRWVCERCGGRRPPDSPYMPRKYGENYCKCN